MANFNPRAPCGARHNRQMILTLHLKISTHAPLAGRDRQAARIPCQEAISTHAPLAGRDQKTAEDVLRPIYFNPRAPCGARPVCAHCCWRYVHFNPRAPCGARLRRSLMAGWCNDFNPRAPCGARPGSSGAGAASERISTHAPLAGRDGLRPCEGGRGDAVFQPTRPLRGATSDHRGEKLTDQDFNPRAPCGARRWCNGRMSLSESISTHAPLAGRDSKSVQITMHIFAITDKFQMLLHRMPPVRAFCSFLMQENHADFGCEPPK